MKFDIIIGNPPYNDDLYLDFIIDGYNFSSNLVCMITPAKWAVKPDFKNERFRVAIEKNIKEIVFFADTKDIFDVDEPDGITYFLIDKAEHVEKHIVNKSVKQEKFNNEAIRAIEYTINNSLNSLVNKIVNTPGFNKFEPDTSRNYWITAEQINDVHREQTNNSVEVYGGDNTSTKLLYGYLERERIYNNVQSIDKYKLIMHFKLGKGYTTMLSDGKVYGLRELIIYNPGEICKNDYMCIFVSDNIEEINSLKSYFNTKFIRALAYAGCCGANASNLKTWSYIPIPERLDITYTDEMLYQGYKLNEQEIELIETIMKER